MEWWMKLLFSCESPFLELNFCYLCFKPWLWLFPGKSSTSLIPHTLSLHSLNLRDLVSSQTGLPGGLWEMISFSFCLLQQAWIWTQVLTSLTSGALLPSLVPVPYQVLLCTRSPHPSSPGGWVPPPDPTVLAGASPSGPGEKGGRKKSVSSIPDEPPRNGIGNC
jgi:hypothetical protein